MNDDFFLAEDHPLAQPEPSWSESLLWMYNPTTDRYQACYEQGILEVDAAVFLLRLAMVASDFAPSCPSLNSLFSTAQGYLARPENWRIGEDVFWK
jgi:hypothetical protein